MSREILSLWDLMQKFKAAELFGVSGMLMNFQGLVAQLSPGNRHQSAATDVMRSEILRLTGEILRVLETLELTQSLIFLRRLCKAIESGAQLTLDETRESFGILGQRIYDELETQVFMQLTPAEMALYEERQPFGAEIETSIPQAAHDIEEATKCLALGRATACVFHLMRVMEIGVQELGTHLGISLATEKVWQVVLDQINKAVRTLPTSTADEKRVQSEYASAASHLYNVKLAWRNQVMHPKASYNPDEARDVFNHTKAFMRQLIRVM